MWNDAEHDQVVKLLAVVCEVTGTELSDPAKALVLKQLSAYPPAQVLASLERCARECKFKLTLADVVSRLDDGRPSAEEAWSSFPKSENDAGVVTEEMSVAWGAGASLVAAGDLIAARMAFKEVYEREVRRARDAGQQPKWRISPGFSKVATEGAAIEALQRGLVPLEHALHFVRPENEHLATAAVGRQAALPTPELPKALLP